VRVLREHAPTVLLVVVVGLFVAYPIADRSNSGLARLLIDAMIALVLIAALVAEQVRIRWRTGALWAVVGVTLLRFGGTMLRAEFGTGVVLVLAVLTEVSTALLLFYFCGTLLRRLTRQRSISMDTVAGAAAVYVLLIIAFGNLHITVYLLEPDSSAYRGLDFPSKTELLASDTPLRALGSEFTYYSAVTQTTLGYGDVLPRSPVARGLAVAQTIIGQLYLAILLARLVAMELSHRSRDPDE